MKNILLITLSVWLLVGCSKPFFEKEIEPNAVSTFEYLWKECDEKYSFFDYKGVDWGAVRSEYSTKIYNGMPSADFFDVLFDMLNELKDGHVNLKSSFQVARFDITKLGPINFEPNLVKDYYLSDKYYIMGGFSHDSLAGHNIGYIRYNSFSSTVTDGQMDYILNKYRDTDGLIFDVRANGGGSVLNIHTILGHFVRDRTLIYDSYIKSGKGHDDFGPAEAAYIDQRDGLVYLKPVVVLTDRGSYSATSYFSLGVRAIDHMTLIGDTTGGGLGAPNGGQLPNGWTYRFSITRTFSHDGQNFENGVPPNIQVDLDPADVQNGIDTIIERAIAFIETGA